MSAVKYLIIFFVKHTQKSTLNKNVHHESSHNEYINHYR